jgi:RNA polymerase sigma factor for flagellar operon FliA
MKASPRSTAAAAVADYDDRDRLVMEHVGLVKSMAHRLVQRLPSQVEVNDLVSVGVLGLIDAAARYKPSTGVPFDAFARRRVHGAMLVGFAATWTRRSRRSARSSGASRAKRRSPRR